MGDLRNKLAKELREQAHRRWLVEHRPSAKPPALPRCECGLTYYEVPIMWTAPTARWEPAKVYCPAYLPHELLGEEIPGLADLHDGD